MIEQYRKKGWKILNRVKGGALGSIDSIWDLEGCIFAASFCETYEQFHIYFKAAYKSAIKNGWVEEIRKILLPGVKPVGYFKNKENCRQEALKYKRRVDFMKGSPGAYKVAMQGKFLDDICVHMIPTKKPKGYYTKNICKELKSKCTSKMDFKSKYSTAYAVSVKNGWINEFFPKKFKMNNE